MFVYSEYLFDRHIQSLEGAAAKQTHVKVLITDALKSSYSCWFGRSAAGFISLLIPILPACADKGIFATVVGYCAVCCRDITSLRLSVIRVDQTSADVDSPMITAILHFYVRSAKALQNSVVVRTPSWLLIQVTIACMLCCFVYA